MMMLFAVLKPVVSWSPEDNPFKGGTQYTATVPLTAETGYTFTGGLSTATINGQSATVINNTGGATVTLSYSGYNSSGRKWN